MRFTSVTSVFVALALSLMASRASAQAGPSPIAGSESLHNEEDNPDRGTQEPEVKKPWEVGGIFETHRMIRQEDTTSARNKVYNILYLHGHYDITERNRVYVRGGAVQRFIGDAEESGIRLDDFLLKYTRYIPLPQKFDFRVAGTLYAPTSFSSQKSSLITEPRITLQLERSIGDFDLSLRVFGEYFWTKYRTMEGGSPNAKWRAESIADVVYSMPFHKPLQVGVQAFMGYLWYYDVQSSQPTPTGVVQTPDPGQPPQQEYGGEAYVKYTFPKLKGFDSDITFSYSQGDSTSVLHDGARQAYPFFYRNTSNVYLALSARY